MKFLFVTIIVCTSSLAEGSVLAAAPPVHSSVANQAVLVADNPSDNFASTRDEYLHKAANLVRDWQKRMNYWTAEAEDKSRDVHQEARQNLDKAWSALRVDWQRLQKAAPSKWDEARAAFDEASQRLKSAWQRTHPQS